MKLETNLPQNGIDFRFYPDLSKYVLRLDFPWGVVFSLGFANHNKNT